MARKATTGISEFPFVSNLKKMAIGKYFDVPLNIRERLSITFD